jgi:D-alanine--(R)-lactate ligase
MRIGIVFGGCSEEHPVSVKSAQEMRDLCTPSLD